jgi:hypothetical protein
MSIEDITISILEQSIRLDHKLTALISFWNESEQNENALNLSGELLSADLIMKMTICYIVIYT